jgi:hypothetical protein
MPRRDDSRRLARAAVVDASSLRTVEILLQIEDIFSKCRKPQREFSDNAVCCGDRMNWARAKPNPIICLGFFASFANAQSSTSAGDKVSLLENPQTHESCAYRDDSEWMSDVESLIARDLGRLMYSRGVLKEILITHQDETGDWSVEDRYTLSGEGSLEKLSRRIEILSGDRSVREVYSMRNGRAVRQSRGLWVISTNRPVSSLGYATVPPQLPIETQLRQLPFAVFITGNGSSSLSGKKVCLPSKP